MMKALVFTDTRELQVQEREIPQPAEGEVQIEVKAVSICGSDLGAYRHATERFQPPLVLGHEFAGVITRLGKGVRDLKEGQRVTVNPILYCGECYHCKRGEYNLCGNRKSLGTAIGGTRTDGAMRQYMTVRSSAALPLREGISFSDGALLEPMGVCLACAKCGHTAEEETVVLIGTGPIGLLVVKFLRSMGIKNSIVSDVLDARLQKALDCGATHAFNAANVDVAAKVKEITNGVGADRVIIAAGIAPAITQGFALVRNGGTVVLVALIHDKVEFDPMELVGRGVKFLGSYMFTTEMKEAMDLLAEGKLTVSDLVTSKFPLEDGKKAFELLLSPGNTEVKVQLTME
jgi:threonine dehydrogenase-like Zn-dependent dehydrogenase